VRITALVAFAIVLAMDVLYITVINAQNQGASDDMPYVPRFVASYLALMAASSCWFWSRDPRSSR
jgi:uncharacterized membrane protein YadS